MKNIFTIAMIISLIGNFALAAEESYSRAEDKPFYAAVNFVGARWNNARKDGFELDGKITPGFDLAIGARATDNIRLELNYYYADVKYDALKMNGHIFFLNALYDGRFRAAARQWLVPYVGFGIGVSRNSTTAADTDLGERFTPVVAALTGLAFELNRTFSIDVGYRYMYMFSPDFIIAGDTFEIPPTSHQLRTGLKVSF
ncbi:MAG: porin family protein [Alphaproteobacteria bacterium]|nr:porin family protein [Alphaproteobacteria bacterium]MCL2758186.1 porin family protein [Alphaproteobacteria bacterium]